MAYENSDVLPSWSVAVDVTNRPVERLTDRPVLIAASPELSVVTAVVPRYVCPSPRLVESR